MNYNEYRTFVNNNRFLFEQYADKMLSQATYEDLEVVARQCSAEIMIRLTDYKRDISLDDAMNTAVKIFGEEVLPLVKSKSDYYAKLYGYSQTSSNYQKNSFQSNNQSNWSTSVRENYNNDESLKVGGIISLVLGGFLFFIAINAESIIIFLISIFLIWAGIQSINEYKKKK